VRAEEVLEDDDLDRRVGRSLARLLLEAEVGALGRGATDAGDDQERGHRYDGDDGGDEDHETTRHVRHATGARRSGRSPAQRT